MKTSAIVLSSVVLLVLVVVAPAWAQGMVGRPAPEISAPYWLNTPPLTLKGLAGKLVIVEFWATWCPPCRKSIPHLIELSKKYASQGVVFIGLTDEPRDGVEPFAKQMGMTYAVGGGTNVGAAYGVEGIPTAFLVDTAGKVVWEGHPMDPAFVQAIESQLKKTPPTMMSVEGKALAKVFLDKAEEGLKKGEVGSAAAALARLPKVADSALQERVETVRKMLAEAVAVRAAEAEQLIAEKDYYKASLALTQLAALGADSEQAKKAQARLKELTGDEKVKAEIERGRREGQAADALAEVEKAGQTKSTAETLAALDDLATRFPDTKAGKAAADKAKAMRADPELMKKVMLASADKDCKGWLSMARNFMKAGLKDKAKSYLDQVIQKYPDTDYAKEAKEMLAALAKMPAE